MSCFCCLDEDAKVGKIMHKFSPVPAAQHHDFMLSVLVGRIVLAGEAPLYAPCSGKPCVYYKIEIEQEWRVREVDNEDGSSTTHDEWETVVEDELCRDFYIQDGVTKLFVNGGDRDKCRIQAHEEESDSSSGWFTCTEPSPGVQALVSERRGMDFGFAVTDEDYDGDVEYRWRTGNIRWTEKSLDVNELVAIMGVPVPIADPYTGQAVKCLQAIQENTLTDEYMDEQEWTDFEKRSWHSLLDEPAVLISDDDDITSQVQVQPVQELPPVMMVPLVQGMAIPANLYTPPAAVVCPVIAVENPVMPGAVPVVQQPQSVVSAANVELELQPQQPAAQADA